MNNQEDCEIFWLLKHFTHFSDFAATAGIVQLPSDPSLDPLQMLVTD